MKKKYLKPEMQVYDMKPTSILCGSGDPKTRQIPDDAPDYNDWLG
jgi:hypothetical protein